VVSTQKLDRNVSSSEFLSFAIATEELFHRAVENDASGSRILLQRKRRLEMEHDAREALTPSGWYMTQDPAIQSTTEILRKMTISGGPDLSRNFGVMYASKSIALSFCFVISTSAV
jgi:hypothetical protein